MSQADGRNALREFPGRMQELPGEILRAANFAIFAARAEMRQAEKQLPWPGA